MEKIDFPNANGAYIQWHIYLDCDVNSSVASVSCISVTHNDFYIL
jgi:hypothetical protein